MATQERHRKEELIFALTPRRTSWSREGSDISWFQKPLIAGKSCLTNRHKRPGNGSQVTYNPWPFSLPEQCSIEFIPSPLIRILTVYLWTKSPEDFLKQFRLWSHPHHKNHDLSPKYLRLFGNAGWGIPAKTFLNIANHSPSLKKPLRLAS